MNKFTGRGETFEFSGIAATTGDVIKVGDRIGVVQGTVTTAQVGVALTVGRFDQLKKKLTDVFTANLLVYWDDTNKEFTVTATNNTPAAWVDVAAGNGVQTFAGVLTGGNRG